MKTETFSFELAGMQHRVTLSTRRIIAREIEGGPASCILEREPRNAHDPNAIKIIMNSTPLKGTHIGYVPRGIAEILAPRLDSGRIVPQSVWLTIVEPDEPSATLTLEFVKVKKSKGAKPVKKRNSGKPKGA